MYGTTVLEVRHLLLLYDNSQHIVAIVSSSTELHPPLCMALFPIFVLQSPFLRLFLENHERPFPLLLTLFP